MHSIWKCDQSLPFVWHYHSVSCMCSLFWNGHWILAWSVWCERTPFILQTCKERYGGPKGSNTNQYPKTQTNIRKHKPIWKAQTNLKKCEQISKNTNQFPETLPWSQRFSFTAKRISSDRQRNLWLPAMRISLSGYNRCLLLENLWHPGYGNTNQFPKTKIQERGWGKV